MGARTFGADAFFGNQNGNLARCYTVLFATVLAVLGCSSPTPSAPTPAQDATALDAASDLSLQDADAAANVDADLAPNVKDITETTGDLADVADSDQPNLADEEVGAAANDGVDLADFMNEISDTNATDSAGNDSVDVGGADSGAIPPVLPVLAACPGVISITAPSPGEFVAQAKATVFAAAIAGAASPTDLEVQWTTDEGAWLGNSKVNASGKSTFSTAGLPQGTHAITATIVNSQGVCSSGATVKIAVCKGEILDSFDSPLTGTAWITALDASWDPGGWIELTGNAQSKHGAIYNNAAYIQPGDVSMRFSIQTGGGINGGADGFAMTILEAKTVADVQTYIQNGQPGGCLGYGVVPPCGTMSNIKAFHVEFDTFHNFQDPFTDPTENDHIGVLLNGDASDHKVYADIPGLEDFQWHDVRIDVDGTTVHVFYDGVEMVTKSVPELDFRGGYVLFTGSTGWASNFHRFDNLDILHQCK